MLILIVYLYMFFYFDIIVKSIFYRFLRVFFFCVLWFFYLCMCKEYVIIYICIYSLYIFFEGFIVLFVEMILYE